MKKLRIKDKEQFRDAMKTLAIALISIILTIIVANVLKERGLESLFTINMYKEAFETNPNDIILINRLEEICIIGILVQVAIELKYNQELYSLKREEERVCGLSLEH